MFLSFLERPSCDIDAWFRRRLLYKHEKGATTRQKKVSKLSYHIIKDGKNLVMSLT